MVSEAGSGHRAGGADLASWVGTAGTVARIDLRLPHHPRLGSPLLRYVRYNRSQARAVSIHQQQCRTVAAFPPHSQPRALRQTTVQHHVPIPIDPPRNLRGGRIFPSSRFRKHARIHTSSSEWSLQLACRHSKASMVAPAVTRRSSRNTCQPSRYRAGSDLPTEFQDLVHTAAQVQHPQHS